jgi:hypothetical protein
MRRQCVLMNCQTQGQCKLRRLRRRESAALVRPMSEDLCAAVVQHIEGVHVQIWQAARQNRC